MNVLAIGNSFSDDALRYIHGIARADGKKVDTVNLYIGGCSLETHFRNMMSEERAYTLQYNGQSTGFSVSIKEALLNRQWDVITLQQVSHLSAREESYYPFAQELAAYVRKYAPTAKLYSHRTWAYEQGCARLTEVAHFETPQQMLEAVTCAYKRFEREICADGYIPSGELMMSLLDSGIEKVHRDTFHASIGLGRYALGLLWYRVLCGADVMENTFRDLDVPISEEDMLTVKRCVENF